jgi:hypothetical protein
VLKVTYFLFDKRIGIQKAAKQCGNIEKLIQLRLEARKSSSPEYSVFINGKTLIISKSEV